MPSQSIGKITHFVEGGGSAQGLVGVSLGHGEREAHGECTALSMLGLYSDLAAMRLDHPTTDREPQSGPFTLGGEEGDEQLLQVLWRDAFPAVDHTHDKGWIPPIGWCSQGTHACAHHNLTRVTDGRDGILDQIEHHLTQLVGVETDGRQAWSQLCLEV